MAETHGDCDPTFNSVRELLAQQVANGSEVGASICVNIDGRNVLDIWSGHADPQRTKPWDKDTLTAVWSCSKVVTNLAALMLVDRGLLDPQEKVSKYWPEFAANGKENVKVSHILSHSSGVAGWEPAITWEEVYDTKKATDWLAAQGPWWTPGLHSGYHLTNQGHMVGEIVRRISGRSLKQFIAEEIAGPLGADFTLGLPEKDWLRTAEPIAPPPMPLMPPHCSPIQAAAFAGPPASAEESMTPGFRGAEIGASNGFGNARALARIGSLVALNGTIDGKQYLSPDVIDRMLEEQVSGMDLVLSQYLRFGLGVGLPVPQTVPWIPEGRICFWGGWGGSIIIMDLDRRMTIGYAMNKMGLGTLGNENTELFVREIYKVVNAL
jgi:CubicO group peptidase (beta-lactamase class C family)